MTTKTFEELLTQYTNEVIKAQRAWPYTEILSSTELESLRLKILNAFDDANEDNKALLRLLAEQF